MTDSLACYSVFKSISVNGVYNFTQTPLEIYFGIRFNTQNYSDTFHNLEVYLHCISTAKCACLALLAPEFYYKTELP
jgi:hypothetical protein